MEEKLNADPARFGDEFERVTRFGRETPDLWMQHATGRPVVAEPLLEATAAAAQTEETAR